MIQILVRVKVKDLPAFVSVFSTRGAALRKKHGSRSAGLFQVTESTDEMVVLFDWDSREAFQGFLSDPQVQETMKASGAMATPTITYLAKVADFPG